MTIDEYRSALDSLSDEAFAKFQHHFGGQHVSREGRVTEFVHTPKHERHISSPLERRVCPRSWRSAR